MDAQGRWLVKLCALKAGGPDKLTVSASNVIELDDVLVGEVWVGSGQSNMQMGMQGFLPHDARLAELVAAAPHPRIRLFGIKGQWQAHATSRWELADAGAVSRFSPQLFAFCARLQQELNVPVGLILGAVSGSPSGAWIPRAGLEADADSQALISAFAATFDQAVENQRLAEVIAKWEAAAAEAQAQGLPTPGRPGCPPRVPGELYCSTVGVHFETYLRPVVPFGIRGVLWDQGENAIGITGLNSQAVAMRALIRSWRQEWGQGDFPFIYVQKESGGGCAWDYDNPVTARADPFAPLPATAAGGPIWADYLGLMTFPNTGMAISSDLGGGQHPLNKSGYARRAADVALGMVYGKLVQYYGPIFESATREGATVRVRFTQVGRGLAWRHGEKLQGFSLSRHGGHFLWADAVIDGDTVVVSHPEMPTSAAVRYGWHNVRPWANLFNKDGLPAIPFSARVQ